MDQAPLVEAQFNDAQKLLDRLAEAGIALGAAWVKESDAWQWYLYLVTPLVGEDGGTRSAYGQVLEVFRAVPLPFALDPFQLKVVGPSEPVGKAILNAQRGHPGRGPIPYGGFSLGGLSIDGAFIYPAPVLAARSG
jgi:hypothetical protein